MAAAEGPVPTQPPFMKGRRAIMQITIEHEVPGRMRVKLAGRVPDADLDALRRVLLSAPAIAAVSIYPRIG